MPYALEILLYLTLPATAACAFIYWLGHKSSSAPVGLTMRVLSGLWWVWVLALTALLIVSYNTCDPKYLFAFENCSVIPNGLASSSFELTVYSVLGGPLTAALLLVIFGISEWVIRKRAKRAP